MALRIGKDRLVFITILSGSRRKAVGRRVRPWDGSECLSAVGTNLPLDRRGRVATCHSGKRDVLSRRDGLAGWVGRDRRRCQRGQHSHRCRRRGGMPLRIRKDCLELIAILRGGHRKTVGR